MDPTQVYDGGVEDLLPPAADAPRVAPDDPRFETADDPRIPAGKMFFKIGEVSKITCVPPYVLRYWETEFSWVRPTKTSSRQRLYRRQDIALLLQIKRLRYDEQHTIASAKDHIRRVRGQDRGSPGRRGEPAGRSRPPRPATTSGADSAALARALGEMREAVEALLQVVEDSDRAQ